MSKTNQPWNIEKPDNFYKKQVKLLPFSAKKKLQSIMNDMIYSNDPTKLGIMKTTKYGSAYVINLNDSYRLAYMVHPEIELLKLSE